MRQRRSLVFLLLLLMETYSTPTASNHTTPAIEWEQQSTNATATWELTNTPSHTLVNRPTIIKYPLQTRGSKDRDIRKPPPGEASRPSSGESSANPSFQSGTQLLSDIASILTAVSILTHVISTIFAAINIRTSRRMQGTVSSAGRI